MSEFIHVEMHCTAMSANTSVFSSVSARYTGQIQLSACQAVGVWIAALPVRHAAEAIPRRYRPKDVEMSTDSKALLFKTVGLSHIHTAI
jgi:hypothetical protein